ncbi:helix-turn-helix domain-containing protein [Actinomadura geliboluensis]|uniref:Helix-turn-helix transcriptional regulator n=1 Tax=Actinomadura geliboluensis TaxID=882440 RepID=A0A5S4HK22_9ACTN|nr:helix-turn-helix transcriptional regulator [Actinomadura geliboluensis]TMR40880.1 helix-turn-helix transcriptional regulator [Actinomadura geliboluensis]
MVVEPSAARRRLVMEGAVSGRGRLMAHGRVRLDAGKLRRLRLRRGLTVDGLAALTGGRVPARQLWEYEAGRRRCDPARYAQLCRALGVAPPELSEVGIAEAALSDLRHWAGLTADQAAGLLGVSSWSLLRAEREGRLPQGVGRGAFVVAAARAYMCSTRLVEVALRRAESRTTTRN